MEELQIQSLITDLALILTLGAVATIIFKLLKQPVVLGYIVAGFIASPHFAYSPSVGNEANIEFWAQLGIVVLLFSLGLEFSFKKLINAGVSAIVTALIIVGGMLATGFLIGKCMGFTSINSIFLGAMLSMSSTTIILKALTDLNMKHRKFVPGIFAVLIVEDLFAVVMMVILSSIAINKTVEGGEMVMSILKLSFFLIIWFVVGVFVIPSIFRKFRLLLSDEMMLVIAMGLCFLMAIFSVASGFSLALGAFVMGSILAGTSEAERIERIINPVKDLFGAVFFISVGMMVNPQVIVQYAGIIALLSVVVIVGMIIFGTTGMLATGQSLKSSMESGFSLTQIGEFSFIIATLGTTLGVLDESIYPIIVTVSVITTFTTPFFIKAAKPSYNFVEKHLPKRWSVLLEGYSKTVNKDVSNSSSNLWSGLIKRNLLRLGLYSVVIVASIFVLRTYLIPFVQNLLSGFMSEHLALMLSVIIALLLLSPFFYAIVTPKISRKEKLLLNGANTTIIEILPRLLMAFVGGFLSMAYVASLLYGFYSVRVSAVVAIVYLLILIIIFAPIMHKQLDVLEKHFMSNVNERENRRTGKDNNLVSDMHLAYMTVGYNCPFVGERLKNADLRRKYGVNVVAILRNSVRYPIPTGDMRIFPGDQIGIIGTDEQIQTLLPLLESKSQNAETESASDVEFVHFALTEKSPLLGKKLAEARLRDDYKSLLVALERGEDNFLTVTPDLEFAKGDILWIVGDKELMDKLK
ncbi:MAG: cation:proton antiporter [Muribaculaceae bacterium]|nr:cation:proton antiporter [Muribaculaceae bacterium]